MSKKDKMKKIDLESFFVYSTDPDYEPESEPEEVEEVEPGDQKLFVRKEKKGRGGKTVTVIEGFEGPLQSLEDLARDIKQHCGTGGSVKEENIIIQGDRAEQIVKFLTSRGFYAKKTTM
ncbi:translation initiation factor [bacterium]|nr:translation initiation factor [bacterium]